MEEIKKCSSKKHNEMNAISYCDNCKIYICNKCQNLHSELFEDHNIYKIDKENPEISFIYCKENGHLDKLRYYCKTHNKLCCSACICKIKDDINGQHSNCEVCIIKEIKDEKKLKLKDNMKQLEELSTNIKESINKIKLTFDKINENKEKLKLKVQKVFTNIRNVINNREDELLLEIDNIFNKQFIEEHTFKEMEKLPNKIKLSLEKGKSLDKEWDNDSKIYSLINTCINIENNIKEINTIKEKIIKCNNVINSNIIFYPFEEKEISLFLEKIKTFGQIKINYGEEIKLLKLSKILGNNIEYYYILKNWIDPNEEIKYELLYRLSEHGEEFSKFHELCDNKGPLLVLYHVNNGDKIGLYTPLILNHQNKSYWQNDKETFLFNLNQNKKYIKIKKNDSLFYGNDHGIYTAEFGNGMSCKTMKKLVHYASTINSYYKDGSEILPSNKQTTYYELLEVEVFKVSKTL